MNNDLQAIAAWLRIDVGRLQAIPLSMRLGARSMRQMRNAAGIRACGRARDVHPIRSYANGRQQSQEIDI